MSFFSKLFGPKKGQEPDKPPAAQPPRVDALAGGRFYPPGAMIDERYEVASHPMMGGMGVVYVCFDHLSRIPVALKTFKPELLSERAVRDRFLREGTMWVGLGAHPHIVRCLFVFQPENRLEAYLVLELIAKEQGRDDASLQAWLRACGALPLEQALAFGLQIVRGMRHATTVMPGLVHRDLKPGNVLVGADKLPGVQVNRLRVTDFGLASVLQEANSKLATSDAEGTQRAASGDMERALRDTQLTRGIVGTPLYMAPEQWHGKGVCAQTDMYALGCILYEMVAGQPVVKAKEAKTCQLAHCLGELQALPQGVPNTVREIILRCLAMEPGQRYGSWAEVEERLAAACVEITGSALTQTKVLPESRADRVAAGWSYNAIGNSYTQLGKFSVAKTYFEQVQEIGRAEDERSLEASGLRGLCMAHTQLGDPHRALECINQCRAITRQIGNRSAEWQALCDLGNVYHLGFREPRRALEFYEQALELCRKGGDLQAEGFILGSLGAMQSVLGNAERAIDFHKQALAIAARIGDRPAEGRALGNLGLIYAGQGNAQQAIAYYEKSLTVGREIGDARSAAHALGNLGNIYADLGDEKRAVEHFEQALEAWRQVDDAEEMAVDCYNLASLYIKRGDLGRALALAQQATALWKQVGSPNVGRALERVDAIQALARRAQPVQPPAPKPGPAPAQARVICDRPKDEVITLTVAQDGTGDCTQIQPAMDAALPGDTVLVRAGDYVEDVLLRAGITLRGESAERIRLVAAAGSALRAEGIADAVVLDLSIDGAGKKGGAICLVASTATITGCVVSGSASAGIEARDKAHLTARGCTIRHNRLDGVLVHQDSRGEIEDNTIFENGLHGIQARAHGRVVARRNTLKDNGEGGAFLYQQGEAVLEGNVVTGNKYSGIMLRLQSQAQVRGNTIHNNRQNGVDVCEGSEATLEQNTIFENGVNGIEVSAQSQIAAHANTIAHNKEIGVWVSLDGRAELRHNIIAHHFTSGLDATGNPGESPAASFTLSHNCVWDNHPNYKGRLDPSSDLQVNPCFVDAASGDYRLCADSPCIGAGENGETLGSLGVDEGILGVQRAGGKPSLSSPDAISKSGEAQACIDEGNDYLQSGNAQKAIQQFEQALAVLRQADDPYGEVRLLGHLGEAYCQLGDMRRAVGYYERGLALARKMGDQRGEGTLLGNLGIACVELEDVPRAIECHQQALAISQEMGDVLAEIMASVNLALSLSLAGQVRKALALARKALDDSRRAGFTRKRNGQSRWWL